MRLNCHKAYAIRVKDYRSYQNPYVSTIGPCLSDVKLGKLSQAKLFGTKREAIRYNNMLGEQFDIVQVVVTQL